jgi:hypothetical protein
MTRSNSVRKQPSKLPNSSRNVEGDASARTHTLLTVTCRKPSSASRCAIASSKRRRCISCTCSRPPAWLSERAASSSVDNAQRPRANLKRPASDTLQSLACLLEACRPVTIGPTVNSTRWRLSSRISRQECDTASRQGSERAPAISLLPAPNQHRLCARPLPRGSQSDSGEAQQLQYPARMARAEMQR